MKQKGLILLLLLVLTTTAVSQTPLLTRAEKSNFSETSLHSDVMAFISHLQKATPYLRVESLGKSVEGRDIPLLILADPMPVNPSDLRYDNRAVIYFQANIHAGEVEGKEAVMMLLRDLTKDGRPALLDDFVLLVTPIFNADGNEKLSASNRRDNGPELAGIRYNGWNLDLNRDGMKQESPEVRYLMEKVFRRWDPLLFLDCHTTNGSYHDEPVTYLWPLNPNGDEAIIEYMHSEMMPSVRQHLKKEHKVLSIPYGNFKSWKNPEEGWQPAGPEPRYLTNYYGMRNRFSILLENYAYADFKTRVWGNYYFLKSVLHFCQTNKETMQQMILTADRTTISRGLNPAVTDSFAIAFAPEPLGRKIEILGYEHEAIPNARGYMRYRKTDKKKTYHVPLYHKWVPLKQVRFPWGYFITINDPAVVSNLRGHGILVEKLQEEITCEAESYLIKKVKASDPYGRGASPYQGHYMNQIEGEIKTDTFTFAAGTYFIPTAQPLGDLAAYLLEPQSDDGLLVWNFFDRYITAQWSSSAQPCPVYKCYKPVSMEKISID